MQSVSTEQSAAGADPGLALPFAATAEVRAAIDGLGRTEDARFSPDNRRLALACFDHDAVALLTVEIATEAGRPHVTVTGVTELWSPKLRYPHGVDFLDDETIVVASRGGGVTMFALPDHRSANSGAGLMPIEAPAHVAFERTHTPGSVRGARGRDGHVEVLVCNNSIHVVTRHVLPDDTNGGAVGGTDRLLTRWLDIPDGVALSDDGRWIAISNHEAHCVMLYEWTPSLDESSAPCGVLRGTLYPHGLCFSADARHLVVADAARPYLHVYERSGDSWRSAQYPAASLRVMDDDTYRKGRYNPEEGGPKGLDIDRSGRVIAVTADHQQIAFFDASALLAAPHVADHAARLDYEEAVLARNAERKAKALDADARAAGAEAEARAAEARATASDHATREADEHARTSDARARDADDRARAADARADVAEAQVAAYEHTKLMRLARPFRRAYGRLRARHAGKP